MLGIDGSHHLATLQALVDAGADLDLADSDGNTPFQLARQHGHGRMVKILEGAGAR